MKRIPGIPKQFPEPPWDRWGPYAHAPGNPQGHSWDPPVPPGDPHGPQNSHNNKLSAPEAFNCCIRLLSLQRIITKLPWTVLSSMVRTEPFLVGHKAERGETHSFRKGQTPHGERSLPIRPQGQAPLYILDIHTYIYVCIHEYAYVNHKKSLEASL